MHEIPVTAPVRSKSSYFPALVEPRMPPLTFIYLTARLLSIFRGECDKAMPWAIASRLLGEKPAAVPVHGV